MTDNGRLYAAEWWTFEGDEPERVALEVERTDQGEVGVTVRGLDGEKGPGSFYLSLANARDLAKQLRGEASEEST